MMKTIKLIGIKFFTFAGARVGLFILLAAVLFSGCARANTPAPGTSAVQPGKEGGLVTIDRAPFALAAKKALAEKLAVPEEQVSFVEAKITQWPDACLGLPEKGMMCAQRVVPGYMITFKVNGTVYEVHTDETGDMVKIKP